MPDTTDAPTIRAVLKAGQKPEPETPMLRLVRWKLVPIPAEVAVVEPEPAVPPCSTKGSP
jgi:hypothetical protein